MISWDSCIERDEISAVVNQGNEMIGKRCHMQQNEESWQQICRLVWIYDTTAEVILDEVQLPHHVHLEYIAYGGDSPHSPVTRFWPLETHTLPSISLFLHIWMPRTSSTNLWGMNRRDTSYLQNGTRNTIDKSRVVIDSLSMKRQRLQTTDRQWAKW